MNIYAIAASDIISESAKESINYLETVFAYLADKAQVLVNALLVLIVGWYICKFIRGFVKKSLEKSKLDASATSFITSLTKFALWALLAIIVISKLGVDMTSIIALLTSASLAVGLALQGSLSNLAGGMLLLIMKPFVVGDFINDGSGHEGTVAAIEITYTKLITPDNQTIYIPNGTLSASTITNVNTQDKRRIDFKTGISYTENIDKARSALLKVALNSENILADTAPQVFIDSFDKSSVQIVLRVWCESAKYWDAKFEVQEAIKNEFDTEGIIIPFEQMDVNIVTK